jgi:hypothetical protein
VLSEVRGEEEGDVGEESELKHRIRGRGKSGGWRKRRLRGVRPVGKGTRRQVGWKADQETGKGGRWTRKIRRNRQIRLFVLAWTYHVKPPTTGERTPDQAVVPVNNASPRLGLTNQRM